MARRRPSVGAFSWAASRPRSSFRRDGDPLPHSPLAARSARAHPRGRRWGGGRRSAAVSAARGPAVRRAEARLDRAHPPAARALPRRVPAATPGGRRTCAIPGRAALADDASAARPHPPARRPARRRVASGAGRRLAARRARGLVPPARPRGSCRPPRRRGGPRRRSLSLALDPRAAHPLGVLLLDRRDELQLQPAPRPARDPRLRDRARGGAPPGPRPLRALLATPGLALRRLARARGLAAPARPGPPPVEQLLPAEEAHREHDPRERP